MATPDAAQRAGRPPPDADILVNAAGIAHLRDYASTEEVADMVVYACSAQALATSGPALRVEGGVVATWRSGSGRERWR